MMLKNKRKKKKFNRHNNANEQKKYDETIHQQNQADKQKNVVEYLAPVGIRIDYSTVAGIGVFATKDFNKGDIIERCPMVRMEHRSNYVHDPTINNYMYSQPKCSCTDCTNHGHFFWMVLGYGMLYNHQDFPNCDWKFVWNSKYADVIANKDIKMGEEIFVSYGSNYFRYREKTLPKNQSDNIGDTLEDIDIENDSQFMSTVSTFMSSVKKNS